MRRPISRYGVFGLLLALSLAVFSGSGLSAAAGHKAASLKVSAPATVAGGASFKVTASGYSGTYNGLAAIAYGSSFGASSCPNNPPSRLYTKVPKNHSFSVKLSPTQAHPELASSPGTHTVCVLLFNSASSKEIVKVQHYRVT